MGRGHKGELETANVEINFTLKIKSGKRLGTLRENSQRFNGDSKEDVLLNSWDCCGFEGHNITEMKL